MNADEVGNLVARVFRGCSPRLTRPTFTGEWEPVGGTTVLRKSETTVAVVECYRYQSVSGHERIWSAGNGGFVAVIPKGGAVEWRNRFGERYVADESGVRFVPEAKDVL